MMQSLLIAMVVAFLVLGVMLRLRALRRRRRASGHCCYEMYAAVSVKCSEHPSRFDCPDCLIHQRHDGTYGLIIHDGGGSTLRMYHCPFCGSRLSRTSIRTMELS